MVEPRELQAGPITVLLDGIDLRYERIGSFEAIRRIYMAVRDPAWGTGPAEHRITRLEQRPDGFSVELEAEHRQGDIDFVWRGEISGSSDGTVRYSMDGVARSSFQYNRIGLCVLAPMELKGAEYRARSSGGSIAGVLPELIGPQRIEGGWPQPLFGPFDELAIKLDGDEVLMNLTGDLFEIEDQRNWTDASYKIYSTPLSLGFPHQAEAGQRIIQTATIRVRSQAGEAGVPQHSSVTLGAPSERGLPAIGFGMAMHSVPLSAREVTLLQAVQPSHLRVDLLLDRPLRAQLKPALDASAKLGCPLELAVYGRSGDGDQLDRLADLLVDRTDVARILVLDRDAISGRPTETTSRELMELARTHLDTGSVPLVGGTDLNFCELNRTRPPVKMMDGVTFSVNPQVHAADDLSVTETVIAQGETVRTALTFAGGLPISVSPITLKPRVKPEARDQNIDASQALPPDVDPRQVSLLAAAWTVGSVASLSLTEATSLTYFETVGWKGLMERESGSSAPDLFPSSPATVFPLYHVFADLAEWYAGQLLDCACDRPLAVAALAVQTDSSLHLLLANLTAARQQVICDQLPGSSAYIRRLDHATVALATSDPEVFRRQREQAVIQEGKLSLHLAPYQTLRIDL